MEKKYSAVALGLFDGVHLGHRAVLKAASDCKQQGMTACAFTFPSRSAAKKGTGGFIYGDDEKAAILTGECGIERIYSPPFADICGMDGAEFAERILRGELNAAFVCCGNDFRFGKGASCGIAELRSFGERYGFRVETVEDVLCGGERVSSTLIRRLLAEGSIERANTLLGSPYTIMKTVSRGAQLGRTIGFPTANQLFDEGQQVPAYGVYASVTHIDGKSFPSMTDIGMKPTVNYGGAPIAETYIHGFSGDLYGSPLRVSLKRFIRPEMKFSSLEELREQINRDMEAALNIL